MVSSVRSSIITLLLLVLFVVPALAIDSNTFVEAAVTAANERMGQRIFGVLNPDSTILENVLKGANVKLKVFEPNEPNQTASLGFEYSYAKDIARYSFSSEKQQHTGLALNIAADGNVAFDRKVNPNDFLKSRVTFLYYQSTGGVLPGSSNLDPALQNKLEDASARITTISQLDAFPEWQQLAESIRKNLTDQYYFDLAATGGLESDQSFNKKQYVYGIHADFNAKGWNADRSALATFNIFDYPAAVLRLISGVDNSWRPRGSAFPELLIGLDHVEPSEDSTRKELTNDVSGFERARVEVSFRTLAANYQGSNAFIEANFRHYQEISPSAAIKTAKLDKYTFFTVALLMPQAKGLFVSYTTGKLPLDAKNDQVYELGFKYEF